VTRSLSPATWMLCLVLASACFVAPAAAEDHLTEEVRATLATVDKWLGEGATAKGWGKYLKSKELREQLGKGEKADKVVLQAILKQYKGSAAGLNKPQFVAVRKAIELWITDLSLLKKAELAAAIAKAKGTFTPISKEKSAKSKTDLNAAVKTLGAYLSRSGADGAGWKKYLKFDDLQKALAAEKGPDLKVLAKNAKLYAAKHKGLSLPKFKQVRKAIENYVKVADFADDEKLKKQYAEILGGLAKEISQYEKKPTDKLSEIIGARLGWLEKNGQAPAIVGSVRRHYSSRNLFIEVGADIVAAGIDRKIDRVITRRSEILGTDITSTGPLKGGVTLHLVPNRHNAELKMVLKGKTHTNNVGYNGPVTIYSNSVTSFAATKRVFVSDRGLRAIPSISKAVTRSNVYDIAGGRIATNVAWDRVAQSKSTAEYQGARNAERDVNRQLDSEADVLLTKANRNFQEKFRKPLIARDGLPRLLRFSTTEETLNIVTEQANGSQLGAPDKAPTIKGSNDIAVRVHQSMVNNLAASMLGGRKITDEGLRKEMINLTGKLPEKLKEKEDEDPWSITFARRKPVTVAFDDDRFIVTIRGRRYTSGEKSFMSMNVTAEYKLAKTKNGMIATRQGDLKIFPPGFVKGKTKLSIRQQTLRKILERRFGSLFEQKFESHGMELPGNWKKAGKLKLDHLASRAGWLSLAWNRINKPANVAERKKKGKISTSR